MQPGVIQSLNATCRTLSKIVDNNQHQLSESQVEGARNVISVPEQHKIARSFLVANRYEH